MRINSKDAPTEQAQETAGVAVAEYPIDAPTTTNGRVPPADAETVESITEELEKRKQKPQKHYSWELAKWVWLMPLNALDQRELNRLQVKKETIIDALGEEKPSWNFDPIGLPLTGVALAWTNSKGQRNGRGQEAIDKVGQFDPAVISELWEIVQKITNWGGAEKNSDKNRGGSASSSSP